MVEKKTKKGREKLLQYRWTNCVPGFELPLRVQLESGKWSWIRPTSERQSIACQLGSMNEFSVDKRFYVKVKK